MEKGLDLSIVIVNFNTKEFLKKCLLSIFNSFQKSELKYEIIIVDNGSTDGSVEFIKKLTSLRVNELKKEKKVKNHQQPINSLIKNKIIIKLIENKKNLGFSRAVNQGIRKAKGKYVLLLNPDTVLFPKTVPYLIKLMEKEKRIGVATCRVELPDGKLDDASHRGFPTPWNAFCHFSGLGKLFPKSKFFNGYHLGYQNLDKIHEIDACAGAFMMIRRKVGEGVGWLDEDYFWYGEDLDFCYRVKKEGWKVMFVPEVKIIHYKGIASGIKKDSQALSTASEATRKAAQEARFEVMRIFYEKHYQQRDPVFVKWLVLSGIRVLSYMNRN